MRACKLGLYILLFMGYLSVLNYTNIDLGGFVLYSEDEKSCCFFGSHLGCSKSLLFCYLAVEVHRFHA